MTKNPNCLILKQNVLQTYAHWNLLKMKKHKDKPNGTYFKTIAGKNTHLKSKTPQEYRKLLKIRREWYAKLRAEGFSDIEHTDQKSGVTGDFAFLKQHQQAVAKSYNAATENFYRLARSFLEHYSFSSAMEKYLWQLYSDGLAYRKIQKLLAKRYAKRYGHNFNIAWICHRLQDLRAEMFNFHFLNNEGLLNEAEQPEDEIADAMLNNTPLF